MRKKKIWLLIIGAFVIAAGLFAVLGNRGAALETAIVERGTIKEYVEDIGTVKCKEQISVSIEGSGLIQILPVDTGQQVRKGDLLLSMDKQQLELQLKDIGEKIKEVEASLQGSEIKNYASNIEKAEIVLNRVKDEYQQALREYENARQLAAAGAIGSEELRLKEAALRGMESAVNTAQIDKKQLEINTPDSIKSIYKAKLGQLVIARESIIQNLKKQDVISPIEGVVLERNVEVNTVGVPGTVAFVIGNLDSVEVEVGILADDVADIRLGNEVEIIERSEKKNTLKGSVVKIAPSAVAVTSSLGVNQKKVLISVETDEKSDRLKPGYETDVRIITEKRDGVLLVPIGAVFEYEGKDRVFAVTAGRTVLKTVRKGIKGEDNVEIIEGLEEGETILSEPDISVTEGMRIKLPKNGK